MTDKGRQDQGQRRDRSPFSITLDTTEPTKKDGEWEMVATATVLYQRRHAPRPPKEVVFQVDGEEVERTPTNDESGQVTTTFIFPKSGSYLAGAFLADEPGVRYTKRINLKAEEGKSRKPVKLNCYEGGSGNDRRVTLEVLTVEDAPVVGAAVRIVDPELPSGFVELQPTNEKGMTTHSFVLSGDEKVIEIRVGSVVTWKNFFRV